MSINPRRKNSVKKKFIVYILLLGVLIVSYFLFNTFNVLNKPLFINPMGRVSTDLTSVEKILNDKKILFSEAFLSDNSYLIKIQNNGQVRLSTAKDINKQVSSLQRILLQLTIEGKPFKNIDFRFSEPIVSF